MSKTWLAILAVGGWLLAISLGIVLLSPPADQQKAHQGTGTIVRLSDDANYATIRDHGRVFKGELARNYVPWLNDRVRYTAFLDLGIIYIKPAP